MSVIDYLVIAVIYFVAGYVLCFKWTQGVKPVHNVVGYILATVTALLAFNLIR